MSKASKEWRVNYYNKKMGFYKWYLGGKCVKCGATDELEFDHIIAADKSFTISSKYDTKWEIVRPELDKCQLLCQICHIEKGQLEGDVKAAAVHGSLGMYRHHKCRCLECR